MTIFSKYLSRKLKVAVIDDCVYFLDAIRDTYRKNNSIILDVYLYPTELRAFNNDHNAYDVILVDHYLGGTNGANLAKKLFTQGCKAKLIVISSWAEEQYLPMKMYFNKMDFILDTKLLFKLAKQEQSKVDIAVESSMLSTVDFSKGISFAS